MNIGDCPYDGCSGTFMLEVPAVTPAYAMVDCDECGQAVWYRFSRIDPMCWTQAGFEEDHDIDHATKVITPRIAMSAGDGND